MLEKRHPDVALPDIIVQVVSSANKDAEVSYAWDGTGATWERGPAEDERAFLDRALAGAIRSRSGVAQVFCGATPQPSKVH